MKFKKNSKNVMGADNQQERLDAKWISGFVDGEGCFHVGINKMPKMTLGWQVLPEFRIVQHKRDLEVLKRIERFFDCGCVRRNHGDRFELRVRGLKDLNMIVAFFDKTPLFTKKKNDFLLFKEIISLMNDGEHLRKDGLLRIAILSSKMNRRKKSKYLVSSETTRQTSKIEFR